MLQESPTAFGADYQQTLERPDSHFKDRTRDDAENFIMAAVSGEELIATAGGLRDPDQKRQHIATVWGMYVHPQHRNLGLGARLLGDVLDRLKLLPGLEHIQLSVTVCNDAALKLYQQAGFQIYGQEPAALKVAGVSYDEYHLNLPV
jgi:ribosomal protein S18 acetylase RimI-like enzyme